MLCVVFGVATSAHAFTVPVAGDMLFDVFDVLLHKIFGGAIGYVIVGLMFIYGIIMLFVGKILAPVIAVVCAIVLANLEAIITSLGFSIVQAGLPIAHNFSAFLM